MQARRVAVLGAIGEDGHGFELRKALAARGIEHDLLIESSGLQTFTYTKLLNRDTGVEDLPRVDYIASRPAPEAVEDAVLGRMHAVAPEFDAIIVSDQAETSQGGLVSAKVRDALAAVPAPRALVSSPVHLRTLVQADMAMPAADLLLCATAPLGRELAAAAEALFHGPLREIYGSTEPLGAAREWEA